MNSAHVVWYHNPIFAQILVKICQEQTNNELRTRRNFNKKIEQLFMCEVSLILKVLLKCLSLN